MVDARDSPLLQVVTRQWEVVRRVRRVRREWRERERELVSEDILDKETAIGEDSETNSLLDVLHLTELEVQLLDHHCDSRSFIPITWQQLKLFIGYPTDLLDAERRHL